MGDKVCDKARNELGDKVGDKVARFQGSLTLGEEGKFGIPIPTSRY